MCGDACKTRDCSCNAQPDRELRSTQSIRCIYTDLACLLLFIKKAWLCNCLLEAKFIDTGLAKIADMFGERSFRGGVLDSRSDLCISRTYCIPTDNKVGRYETRSLPVIRV